MSAEGLCDAKKIKKIQNNNKIIIIIILPVYSMHWTKKIQSYLWRSNSYVIHMICAKTHENRNVQQNALLLSVAYSGPLMVTSAMHRKPTRTKQASIDWLFHKQRKIGKWTTNAYHAETLKTACHISTYDTHGKSVLFSQRHFNELLFFFKSLFSLATPLWLYNGQGVL